MAKNKLRVLFLIWCANYEIVYCTCAFSSNNYLLDVTQWFVALHLLDTALVSIICFLLLKRLLEARQLLTSSVGEIYFHALSFVLPADVGVL